MIVSGAKCDGCGRVDTMEYVSKTAVEVMLRQKGWKFEENKCYCRVCDINKNKNGVNGGSNAI